MTDAIDRAIEATVEEEQTVTMCEVPIRISSTGRPVVIHVPVDLTDAELLELTAFLVGGMRPWIAGRIGPRIWTPPQ